MCPTKARSSKWSLVIRLGLLLLIAAEASSQTSKNALTPDQKRLIPYSRSWGKIVPAPMTPPDSLGGNTLLGYVNMEVRVTKDGMVHGYRVNRIEINQDTLHWTAYSLHTPTPRGDSVYKRFAPWIETYYHLLRTTGTQKDSMFLISDTLWYNHIIDFGSVRDPRQPKRKLQLVY
jgi:hypothetical protein